MEISRPPVEERPGLAVSRPEALGSLHGGQQDRIVVLPAAASGAAWVPPAVRYGADCGLGLATNFSEQALVEPVTGPMRVFTALAAAAISGPKA
jgi:hypothetical protein